MKKLICLLIAFVMLLCGCSYDSPQAESRTDEFSENTVFIKKENGNLVSDSGIEYAHLANEGFLYYLGELSFAGSVQGEEKTTQHLGLSFQNGMFAINGADNNNILIRCMPDSEWFAIYRKASLPEFDYSVDNCIRLKFASGLGFGGEHAVDTTGGEGITDPSEIAAFLSEIRKQQNPHEAGLYKLIEKPDGMLENCYTYGVVYGFFGEEPNLVVGMIITSFNDLAYSISVEGKDYVLPKEWLDKLENK